MKKKAFIVMGVLVILGIIIFVIRGCNNEETVKSASQDTTASIVKEKPLNISIYLDLSDRLTRKMTPSQAERDIAIVEYLTERFKTRAVRKKILPCNDRIKVFFYPSPQDSKVALLSDKLELDLSKTEASKKKVCLRNVESQFKQSLEQIYQSTLNSQNWEGSDIWGFFNKPIDTYCIKKNYRNVLVILTDGYIYHQNNKQRQGNSFSYLSDNILSNPDVSLINGRTKALDELEVLILEINPYDKKLVPRMEKILTNWLQNMGIKKSYVGETDVPSNTRLIIDKFFDDYLKNKK